MPTFAVNDIPVDAGATAYTTALTFNYDQAAYKLTIESQGAAVYIQTREVLHGSYGGTPEMKISPGFRSMTFATPIYGFRIRSAGTAATVTFAYYG